jgi:exoribonuclease R
VAATQQDRIVSVDHGADAVREANGELSLLFNAIASTALAGTRGIWRTKGGPSAGQVESLRRRVQGLQRQTDPVTGAPRLQIDWPADQSPADFARRLSPEDPIQALALSWVQSCGGRLGIKSEAGPHHDLGLHQYTQLTASYRRFADALMTTALELQLNLVGPAEVPGYTAEARDFDALASRLQDTEARHRKLQGKAREYLVAVYLQQHHDGHAVGTVMPHGVKLTEPAFTVRTQASEALALGTPVMVEANPGAVHADPAAVLRITALDT